MKAGKDDGSPNLEVLLQFRQSTPLIKTSSVKNKGQVLVADDTSERKDIWSKCSVFTGGNACQTPTKRKT